MRPGFTPQEDVARFRPSRVLHAEGRAPAPRRAGVGWTEAMHAPRSPAKASPGRVRGDQPVEAPAKGAVKAPIREPAKAPTQGPAKDTMPEWRSTARPRTTKPGPRSLAERDASKQATPNTEPPPDTLDTLGQSLSALSIKDRRV